MIPTLLFVIPASWAISPWLLLALGALWHLPDLVNKWLDVRDHWHRPSHESRNHHHDNE